MTNCDHCGDEVVGALGYTCNECGQTHCVDCRLPESHRCQGLMSNSGDETWLDERYRRSNVMANIRERDRGREEPSEERENLVDQVERMQRIRRARQEGELDELDEEELFADEEESDSPDIGPTNRSRVPDYQRESKEEEYRTATPDKTVGTQPDDTGAKSPDVNLDGSVATGEPGSENAESSTPNRLTNSLSYLLILLGVLIMSGVAAFFLV